MILAFLFATATRKTEENRDRSENRDRKPGQIYFSVGAIAAGSPAGEKAAVTSTFFVVAYIAISVPVIGLGLMASMTSLMTTGITFAAVMGSLAALALVLLIRRERAGGK